MADSTLWWLLAGAAVAVELLTGTFYLLMLAIGLAAGALAAHAGAGLPAQLVAAAVVGGGAVAGWHLVRAAPARRSRAPGQPRRQPGRRRDRAGGRTGAPTAPPTVRYRGASWTVVPAPAARRRPPGLHRVREVVGSRLVVEKI